MKTLNTLPTSPNRYFTVTEKDTNINNALLPNVLYNEMEAFVKNISSIKHIVALEPPLLYKLQVLKNAYLYDKLLIKSTIVKYNEAELHLQTIVTNASKTTDATICKAVFKFNLNNSIKKAS